MEVPHLVVVSGPDKGKQFAIREGEPHVIGRHPESTCHIEDPCCSRVHCQIVFESGKATVVDKGGSGGTLVNSIRIEKQTLEPGDVLQVGQTRLQYRDGQSGNEEPHDSAEYDVEALESLSRLTGRTLTRYRIGPVLGKGAVSMVFRATDTEDGKTVALKVMEPAFSRDEEEMQRFVRAMKSTLPLRHPHLVTMYAAGKSGPYCWAAMEYVDAESLTDVIHRIGIAGTLDWRLALRVAVHVGRALEYAHEQGIIHRNVSPTNILWRGVDKHAKLGDVMLAKALEGVLSQQVTRPGEIVGDINYMSPERTGGDSKAVDHRSDLFSLGATVYALLSGKPPFTGRTFDETLQNIRTAEPVKPSSGHMGIPSAFEGAILRLVAKVPRHRYQSARELLNDLERIGRLNGAEL